MMDKDDQFSQLRGETGGRSGRARDDVSDATSRRRGFGGDDSFKQENSGIPALESSVSRRSNRQIIAKTPGFREEPDTFAQRAVSAR